MLQPVDVVVCLYLATNGKKRFAYIARDLQMAISTTHRSMQRARSASLLAENYRPLRANLLEFLAHGVRYVFYAECGAVVRGVITGAAAPGLNSLMLANPENTAVWPSTSGRRRGTALEPLASCAPDIVEQNPRLYSALAAVDLIRIGKAREREVAIDFLKNSLEEIPT